MEPEGSQTRSEQPATYSCPRPNETIPQTHNQFL